MGRPSLQDALCLTCARETYAEVGASCPVCSSPLLEAPRPAKTNELPRKTALPMRSRAHRLQAALPEEEPA